MFWTFHKQEKTQRLAKFKRILLVRFSAILNFVNFKVAKVAFSHAHQKASPSHFWIMSSLIYN